ncbi:crossover junction endodeoxyribonuclease RuvC [Neomegalonema sp.]|uniref:crossover junction endodeoxyribonuclease RuvC n=1 Tax=Neomegalonema sp. TaxID=2039713 RepID=UPI00263679F5|nr:crossover junction endodeoxyribonuclease RuvC [Neomegalonema sp.]MDD2870184.1 crossover junction endodeoxyribonuclease RuvC [Neomegalonema sp.]
MERIIRVMGIDPGLRRTGWGVVEARGVRLRHLGNGFCAPEGETLAQRLSDLHRRLTEAMEAWKPDEAAVEQIFVSVDAVGSLKLAHARGVALLVPAQAGIPVAEYAPNQIKKTVVGVGKADKIQVQHMVRALLPGVQLAGPDAADALAIAICHVYQGGGAARYEDLAAREIRR